jgi:plastocyanin
MLKFLIGSTWSFLFLTGISETEKTSPKVHTIEIKHMRFEPAELIVHKGDTVVWVNHDIVPHDVTEESRKAWKSPLMLVGKSWSLVVTQSAGYYCSIHVVMKGKLVIE